MTKVYFALTWTQTVCFTLGIILYVITIFYRPRSGAYYCFNVVLALILVCLFPVFAAAIAITKHKDHLLRYKPKEIVAFGWALRVVNFVFFVLYICIIFAWNRVLMWFFTIAFVIYQAGKAWLYVEMEKVGKLKNELRMRQSASELLSRV